ncbi:MAG: radical SAM protein [Planctomycetota bacterium]
MGIDIIPYKICTLNCIYCQRDNTSQKSIDRKQYADKGEILKEVKEYLSNKTKIDFITFADSGESTLNSDIGILITGIKKLTPIPIVTRIVDVTVQQQFLALLPYVFTHRVQQAL